MRKHLIAFAALAFVTLGVRAVGTDGDVASIEAVPNNETGVAYDPYIGNRETPHKVGETFYVLVRLLNEDWGDTAKNHRWDFVQSATGTAIGGYMATVYWPKLGLAIGNKKVFAEFSTEGPNGEISGPNDQFSFFTDLYFKYTVKEGELGLPIHFLNQSQQIIDSGSGSTGFCLNNVNTTGVTGGYWNLCNDIEDTDLGTPYTLATLKYWNIADAPSKYPTRPSGGPHAVWNSVWPGIYVQTIDFDPTYLDEDLKVWRDVYAGLPDVVPTCKAPAIKGTADAETGNTTVYIWSDEESVVIPDGTGESVTYVTNGVEVTHKVFPITLSASGEVSFKLKGGAAANVGKTANICLCTTKIPPRHASDGSVIDGGVLTRKVRLIDAPAPYLSFSDKDGNPPSAALVANSAYTSATQFRLGISSPCSTGFKVKLNPKVGETAIDPLTEKFIMVQNDDQMDPNTASLTEITVPAGAREVFFWIYAFGTCAEVKSPGITFTPSIDAEAYPDAAEHFAHGEHHPMTVRVTDQKPVVEATLPGTGFANDNVNVDVSVIDNWRDLSTKNTNGYRVVIYLGGSKVCESNAMHFAEGSSLSFPITVPREGDPLTGTVQVWDEMGNPSDQFPISMTANAPLTVTPRIFESTSTTVEPDVTQEYAEGQKNLYLRAVLSSKANADMYAFIRPLDAASSNLVFTTAITNGLKITAGGPTPTLSEPAALTLLDGDAKVPHATTVRYSIVLKDKPNFDDPEASVISTYSPKEWFFAVTNTCPYVADRKVWVGDQESGSVVTRGSLQGGKIASGTPVQFTVKVSDLGLSDVADTNNPIKVRWYYTDGADHEPMPAETINADSNGYATVALTFYEENSVQDISIYAQDRDMRLVDRDDFGEELYSFRVTIGEVPRIIVEYPKGNVDGIFYENGNTKTKNYVTVKVSEWPGSTDRFPGGPAISRTNPLKVKLSVEKFSDDKGELLFDDGTGKATNEIEVVFNDKNEGTVKGKNVYFHSETQNGGAEFPSMFELSSEVTTVTSNKAGIAWSEYFIGYPVDVYMQDTQPTLTLTAGDSHMLSVSNTWTAGEIVTIKWTATDIMKDITNGDFTVSWQPMPDKGAYVGKTSIKLSDGTNIVYGGSVAKGTASGTYTFEVPNVPLTEVKLSASSGEGEPGEAIFYIVVVPTKTIAINTAGPSRTTQTKYNATYAGLGRGHVYVEGSTGMYLSQQFVQTWNYNESSQKATILAAGYPASAVDAYDDGKLGEPDYLTAAALSPTGGKALSAPYYNYKGEYDNYFYCWATIDESGQATYTDPNPTTNPADAQRRQFTLDNEKKDANAGYGTVEAEAIFSREWLTSDNCGDINADGIPDLYVLTYSALVGGEDGTEPDDRKKLDVNNVDEDWLPNGATASWGGLIPELPSTWPETGARFTAKLEIRGYGDCLNDAPQQAGIPTIICDKVYEDPDLSPTSTLSKVEWLAYVDAGCPGVDAWSPERPTDPTVDDTDGDGFPDGYEYYFWYRAHVGWMEGVSNHVYLTGRRFDIENPGVGKLITPAEIAAAFDPLEAGGDGMETRDTDNDGLPDLIEIQIGTNPVHWDTDGDGLPDGYEVAMMGGAGSGEEGGTGGYVAPSPDSLVVFDPCGRNVGVDEAMFNGDNDAMAYAPASENPEPIYGFLQSDGSIKYYWIPGATNVVSTNTTPCWVFTQTLDLGLDKEGKPVAQTNVFITLDRPAAREINGEWVLNEFLTEDKCWLGKNSSTNEGETAYIRVASRNLPPGTRMDGEPVEDVFHQLKYAGKRGGCIYRVFQYGPQTYGDDQPYGQWVCGAEVVGPRGEEIISSGMGGVFFIHTHVYQGNDGFDGAKTPWDPSVAWGGGSPYTQLDEFLVCFWHYLDEQPEFVASTNSVGQALGVKEMDMEVRRDRPWTAIWNDYCTNPSTADTDGDGIPDGWELFTMGGPKVYGLIGRDRAYGPLSENAAKNAAGGFASEFHGYTCSLFYGPYCQSIVDSYINTHPFWTNKKLPTDPWEDDTDGDGLTDDAEEGVFNYLRDTPQWKGVTPSYPDLIPGPGAGGGLDPLSWDTDMDGLPDPWEMQYGTDSMGHDQTFGYDGEPHEDGSEPLNCWCIEDDNGKKVPTVDGTVADAGEDYDHDGLLNWQEYLVSAMRCWRYDDTISSWKNVSFDGEIPQDTAWWTERLINGGVFYVKDESGDVSVKCAGIDDWFEYDGEYEGYNPQIQVDGMYDIGANWFSLCTNSFDQAKGRWYMFYDGVYHDLKTGGGKWTVPGMPPDCCNRFTWRAYTLFNRNPFFFYSDLSGNLGFWFGEPGEAGYCIAPNRYPGTDPNDFDTDDDGMDDYYELFHGLNPLLGQSGQYRTGGNPPVDCVYEAYAFGPGGELITVDGVVPAFCSAENNYWTWLDVLEPDNPHFAVPQRKRERKGAGEEGVMNGYDFGRFPWLNGLPYADPDGDNIRNQQEGIFAQVQANSTYLHTDPSPLWMTDKSYGMSLTYRYYQLPETPKKTTWEAATDGPWAIGFKDTFGQQHTWDEFPGYEVDPMEGLKLPYYYLNEWPVPNPNREEADNLATIHVNSFGWDFEENEGYDTDHDYLSDFEEQQGRTSTASNPQDTDDPQRRQAMWFGGAENPSVLQTPLEVERLPVNDSVPAGIDQPYLYYTVECWAKPEGNVNRDQVLVERSIWTSSSNPADDRLLRKNFQIGIHGSDAGAVWYTKYDTSGTDDQKSIEIADGPAVAPNEWTHIAATYDGENLKLYVNGVCLRMLASKVQPEHGFAAVTTDYDGTFRRGSITYHHRTFTVGASICKSPMIDIHYIYADWTHYNQYFQGYIDEVRIWDGARSATEILANYTKRFTAADALENRTTVYNAWNLGYTREAVTTGILPAELKLHWNFDHIPGAADLPEKNLLGSDCVMQQPAGFTTRDDAVDAKAIWSRPEDWTEPWWDGVVLKSNVYTDPAWVPWIIDTVHHLPNYDLTTLDSFYWSEDYAGHLSVGDWAAQFFGENSDGQSAYTKFAFPRTHETPVRWTQVTFTKGPPYTISDRYALICKLCADEEPSGAEMMKRYAFTMRHALREGFDLLPLGGAYPKRVSLAEGGMWDENGAADAWAQTGNGDDWLVDPTDEGVPAWWSEYFLFNHPELDPDKVLRWDTVVDYDGVTMPAWQAYIRDLARGLLPDGVIHPEFADTTDLNRNGLPDWWEKFWKLTNTDADADPDDDGLPTFAEYLAVEGGYPYGTTNGFPLLNPNLTYSTPLKVTDYFLPGPTNDMPAGARHISANEYLGEIFTDHDFMEDWWERIYARTYADPMKYDPLNDKDEDGWSNWAECRAALWGGYFNAELIDSWTGMQSDQHVVNYPEPIIGVKATYHGVRDISGQQLVIRTISGQTKRVDATFVIPPTSDSQTRYLGPFKADSAFHGHLSPGLINVDSVVISRAKNDLNKTYKWNWKYYDDAGIVHPEIVMGSFDKYYSLYLQYPHIEIEGADLSWESCGIAVQTSDHGAKIMLHGSEWGKLNTVTGEFELDMSKFDQNVNEYIFNVTYTSRIGHEWPQTVYVSDTKELATGTGTEGLGNGRVREGRNTIEAFLDLDQNGAWDAGEPIGVAYNVQIGWHKVPEVVIELKDESPVMPCLPVSTEVASFGAGGEKGETTSTIVDSLTKRVRLVRESINGTNVFSGLQLKTDRVLLTKDIVLDDHAYLTEADVVTATKPDLDWTWLLKDAEKVHLPVDQLEYVTYRLDEIAWLPNGSVTNLPLVTFTKELSGSRPKASAVEPIDESPVYTATPKFAFSLSDDKATGYRLQIRAADGTAVYDSGVTMLPGRTGGTVGSPVCEVTPPVFVNDKVYAGIATNRLMLVDGSNYEWRVALYNAKYNATTDEAWSGWAKFQMDVRNHNRYPDIPTGYGAVPVAVRYFGPTNAPAGAIVIEAFESADFRGQPLARLRLDDISRLRSRDDVTTTDVVLGGIRPGQVYLRAYFDINDNGSRDNWESWGYANMVGKKMRAVYNPEPYEVTGTAAEWVYAEKGKAARTIFIEDCDVNCNEMPDCLEPGKFPSSNGGGGGGGGDDPDDPEDPTSPDVDTDGDGMPDVWENWNDGYTDPTVADGEASEDDDVMAFLDETRYLVVFNDDTHPMLLLAEGQDYRQGDNRLAKDYVYDTWYRYGTDGSEIYGLGTNVVITSPTLEIKKVLPVTVRLVHAQVYARKGFNSLTANAEAYAAGTAVDTKPFTALDKLMVLRYLQAIGATPPLVSQRYKDFEEYVRASGSSAWSQWTLKPGDPDCNNDKIADGWQLYVMYGARDMSVAVSGTGQVTPWTAIGVTRQQSPGGEGLSWSQEYDGGHYPTDPWRVDSDDDGVIDTFAYQYGLKGDDAGKDFDGDGLSNYAEYLITEVFKFANVDPRKSHTSDGICDYFRKQGEFYLGEIFTDHDQMADEIEDEFPEMSRYVFDAQLDGDGDGWSNWAEVKAYQAAGYEPYDVVSTNDMGELVTNVAMRVRYAGIPQPEIQLTLNYFGNKLPSGASSIAVVKTYTDGPQMLVCDATYVVSNIVYGMNRLTLANPVSGNVKEGRNWVCAYLCTSSEEEGSSSGSQESEGTALPAYEAGMPYGSTADCDIGWDKPQLVIDVTDQSAIFDRIDVFNGGSSRLSAGGESEAGTVNPEGEVLEDEKDAWIVDVASVEAPRERIRVVPYEIRGSIQDESTDPVEQATKVFDLLAWRKPTAVADFYVDKLSHPLISEADVIDAAKGKFDIEWDEFNEAYVLSGVRGAVSDVTMIRYRMILGEDSYLGPVSTSDTSFSNVTARVLSIPVERRFERRTARTTPEAVLPKGGAVYSAHPVFTWRLDEPETVTHGYGCTYTAFRVWIKDESGTEIWDSGFQRAPARNARGEFVWEAPISVGAPLPGGQTFIPGKYTWQVEMFNAKFQTKGQKPSAAAAFTVATGVQQDVDDHGYSAIRAAVKYMGPAAVLSSGLVRVQVFASADFSGKPVAESVIVPSEPSLVAATDALPNCRLVGIPNEGTYYVRAFIDTNGDGQRDVSESWGSAGEAVTFSGRVTAPVVGVWIEDCDTDGDWLPDAWELVTYGNLTTQGAVVDPDGKIVFRGTTYEGIAGISTGLSGASLTVFNNLAVASAMLGLGDVITIDAIRDAVKQNVVQDSVKVTSLTFDQVNNKIILTVDAEVAQSVAGEMLSNFYTVDTAPTAKVTLRVYKKENLATANWTLAKEIQGIEIGNGAQSVSVDLGSGDYQSGFFKVEVVQ